MTWKEFVNFVKEFEGFRSEAYHCPANVLTIGYGRTEGVRLDEVTTEAQESAWIDAKLRTLEASVITKCENWGYKFNQNQIYALTSFVYNLGIGCLNQVTANGTRSAKVISAKMLLYVNAGGKPLKGLERRRKAEVELFNMPADCSVEKRDAVAWYKLNGDLLRFAGYCETINGKDFAVFYNVNGDTVKILEEQLHLRMAFTAV